MKSSTVQLSLKALRLKAVSRKATRVGFSALHDFNTAPLTRIAKTAWHVAGFWTGPTLFAWISNLIRRMPMELMAYAAMIVLSNNRAPFKFLKISYQPFTRKQRMLHICYSVFHLYNWNDNHVYCMMGDGWKCSNTIISFTIDE